MIKIAELLGLKPEATEEQILKTLDKRFGTATANEAALAKLKGEYEAAVDELKQLRKLPKRDTPTINAEALALKTAAGLDQGQALEVLAAQAEHDKTKPHDPQPATAQK